MSQSVKLGAASKQRKSDSDDEDQEGPNQMGCAVRRAEKRAAKKKGKSIFSLQQLLCKDVEALNTKTTAAQSKKKGSKKSKKTPAKSVSETADDEEFQKFIKQ